MIYSILKMARKIQDMDKIIDSMLQDDSDIEIHMGEDDSDKELESDWEYENELSLDKSSGDRADNNENDVSNTGIVDTPDEGDSVGDQESLSNLY